MDFTANPRILVITIISIIVSLSVHEAMHAYIGLKLGDTTAQEQGRVSFNPLRHIDPFSTILLPLITLALFHAPILAAKPVPFNPDRVKFDEFGAAMIAFAGPASNFLLAALSVVIIKLTGITVFSDALVYFAAINVGLFVFNMVPIPPLDGSRVLFAFAPEWLQNIMAQIEPYGIFVVFGMVLAVPGFGDLLVNIDSSILEFLFRL